MAEQIIINDYSIVTDQLDVVNMHKESERRKVKMTFQVTHEDYHDITTLLYKNDFIIEIPSQQLDFPAVIYNYATSIDNLYKENAVGTFRLELIEKE